MKQFLLSTGGLVGRQTGCTPLLNWIGGDTLMRATSFIKCLIEN